MEIYYNDLFAFKLCVEENTSYITHEDTPQRMEQVGLALRKMVSGKDGIKWDIWMQKAVSF